MSSSRISKSRPSKSQIAYASNTSAQKDLTYNFFKIHSVDVDDNLRDKLMAAYKFEAARSSSKPPKIWGIDPMSTPLALAIVRLYQNHDNKQYSQTSGETFESLNLNGILAFVVDRRKRCSQLRLFDINNFRLIFQCELYLNFSRHYKEIKSTFYCFPLPKVVIGIEFSNFMDADFFRILIHKYSVQNDREPDQMAFSVKHDLKYTVNEEQKKCGLGVDQISRPISCLKKDAAWFDTIADVFILNLIPQEIKTLIKQIGYKKKDLVTPETARQIYDQLTKFGLTDEVDNQQPAEEEAKDHDQSYKEEHADQNIG